ncbi:MAG: hypothetical protein GY754_27835 [bacterium]|nr:hypothetical protein [bacterium]
MKRETYISVNEEFCDNGEKKIFFEVNTVHCSEDFSTGPKSSPEPNPGKKP